MLSKIFYISKTRCWTAWHIHRFFIPFSPKCSNATTLASMIKENNQMLCSMNPMLWNYRESPKLAYWLSSLRSQTSELTELTELTELSKLSKLTELQFVVPTTKGKTHKELRILIKSSKYHAVNGHIWQHWNEWMNEWMNRTKCFHKNYEQICQHPTQPHPLHLKV